MICPKCKYVIEYDDVIYEESHGTMKHYYCWECKVTVDEHGNYIK